VKPLLPPEHDDGPDGPGDHADQLADLAAYLLDALPDLERERVRSHLPSCPRCQAELLLLAPLPSLLNRARLPEGAVPSSLPAPDGLRERVIGRVVSARRRRRRAAGAALVAVAVAAVAVVVAVGTRSVASFQAMTLSRPAPGMHAEVAVTDERWGSAVEVRAVGWKPGATVILAVVDSGGTVERVGSWTGLGPHSVTCSTSTSAHLDSVVAVELESPAGRLEARAPIRH
jgi:hypothetical protein